MGDVVGDSELSKQLYAKSGFKNIENKFPDCPKSGELSGLNKTGNQVFSVAKPIERRVMTG